MSSRSNSPTVRPCSARNAAADTPMIPPPMIVTSKLLANGRPFRVYTVRLGACCGPGGEGVTVNVLDRLDQMIDQRHLLKHPFYTKWAGGTLPIEALQEYARQYYAFESAMPRFLSALHTRTADKAVRQEILDNLWDEEHGQDNHAELWLRFAEGIGVSRDDVQAATPNEATQALTDMYFDVTSDAPV